MAKIQSKRKKIEILSYAKVQAVLFALIGLLVGILYSFGGLLIDLLVSTGWISHTLASTPGLSYGTVLAFGSLIGMPFVFGVFGFITGIIGAFLYNLVSKLFRRINLNFGK